MPSRVIFYALVLSNSHSPPRSVISSPTSRSISQQSSGPSEDYDEPVVHIPGGGSNLKPPTPSSSRENSGSGAVRVDQFGQSMMLDEVPHSWEYDTTAPKVSKMKPSQLKDVRIKGPLEKLGGRSHNSWQKRYCVLSGVFMYFYEKESSKMFNNRIALPRYTISSAPHFTNEKKKHFAFKLTHTDSATGKQKDYYFRTSSDNVRTKWITSVSAVLQRMAVGTTAAAADPAARSATLPHVMPSQQKAAYPQALPHNASLGDDMGGDLYEDLNPLDEEPEGQDEYVAVSPADEDEQGEEYVDVNPGQDIQEEDYEAPSFEITPASTFKPPPPQMPPPPSSLPSKPPAKAPQPIETVVDTSRVYVQQNNGINYDHVFVALWDFESQENDELRLQRGDLVYVMQPSWDSEWWYGEMLDQDATRAIGLAGFFPSSYSTAAFEAAC